jgi:hypothetical protein
LNILAEHIFYKKLICESVVEVEKIFFTYSLTYKYKMNGNIKRYNNQKDNYDEYEDEDNQKDNYDEYEDEEVEEEPNIVSGRSEQKNNNHVFQSVSPFTYCHKRAAPYTPPDTPPPDTPPVILASNNYNQEVLAVAESKISINITQKEELIEGVDVKININLKKRKATKNINIIID